MIKQVLGFSNLQCFTKEVTYVVLAMISEYHLPM